MRTALTERFGLRVPVVQAPMAGTSGGALAAAVTTAGALGHVAAGGTTPAAWLAEQAALAAAAGPYGIGLLAWVLEGRPDLLATAVAARPALVSVSYGPYAPVVPVLHDAGIPVATQVGTLEEAVRAEQAGVDLVVVRGGEGGGHGRDDVSTLVLLQEVLDAVAVPVLAAGGIATARGLAAVLAAGAAGAWVGTAFLACPEALTPAWARDRLLSTPSTGTAYGRVFDVGLRQDWPVEYGGRAVRNAFFARWQGREDELAADDAAARGLSAALRAGEPDEAVAYAGQSVGLLRRSRPAGEVVADLAGAQELLRTAAQRCSAAIPPGA